MLEDYRLSYPLADDELTPLLAAAKVVASTEEYVAQIEDLLSNAFAADLLPGRAHKGFAVLNTINLVIVLADLEKEGTLALMPGVVKAISKLCDDRRTKGSTFYLVGGFIVRRGRCTAPVFPAQMLPKDWKAQLEAVQESFSRIYLLDIRDSQGREIELVDQCHLIENLIHMLTGSQADCKTEQDFAERLSRGHAFQGEAGFLGGASVTFPVDQAVQMAAVIRGAEAIQYLDTARLEWPGPRGCRAKASLTAVFNTSTAR